MNILAYPQSSLRLPRFRLSLPLFKLKVKARHVQIITERMETILVISDLHFGKFFDPKFADPDQLLKQLITCLKEENIKPDFILCPGDLTSEADPEEFREALKFLNGLRRELNLKSEDMLALVGNHDVNWNVHSALARDKPDDLARFLASQVQAFYHWPTFDTPGPAYNCGLIKREKYDIIAFNSSWNCIGDTKKNGELGSVQLEWLAEVSTKIEQDKPVIIALHHHPEPIPYPVSIRSLIKDLSQAIDGQELLSHCEKINVHLIIHGHRHHPALIKIMTKGPSQRQIPLLCAGSLRSATPESCDRI